ncbi:hypothetical protein [Rhizobium sp.]
MGKDYRLRQKILLKKGYITQELHDARIAQWKLMRSLKKEAGVIPAPPAQADGLVKVEGKLSVREKQVIGVLTQRRALDIIAPTCDDIAKLSRLPLVVARATIDGLLSKGVVKPTSHGRTNQARYKLAKFGGLGQ